MLNAVHTLCCVTIHNLKWNQSIVGKEYKQPKLTNHTSPCGLPIATVALTCIDIFEEARVICGVTNLVTLKPSWLYLHIF